MHGPVAPRLSRGNAAPAAPKNQKPRPAALYLAAATGNLAFIKRCIADGMDIDRGDYGDGRDCYTPLLKAAQAGHNDIVIALLDAGANVNFVSTNSNLREDGNTALILASYEGHLPVVQTLLKHHASVSLETASGYSALMFATNKYETCDETKKDDFNDIIQALYLAGASWPLQNESDAMHDDLPPLEQDATGSSSDDEDTEDD